MVKSLDSKFADKDVALMMGFLKDVAANNNRAWFKENRPRYDEASAAFDALTSELIAAVAHFDPSVAGLTPKDCQYRFYRDIRFSQDKSPYKRHFGCFISPQGKKSLHGGYYFHLQPGGSFVAGGCWWLPTKILNVVRQTIVDNIGTFRNIVEQDAFRSLFPVVTFDPLKVLPRGVPRDFAFPQYVKCRNYCVANYKDDDFFNGKDWRGEVVREFRILKPFQDFINEVVDDYI